MVSIHAFQAWDPGSIPGQRTFGTSFFIMPPMSSKKDNVLCELPTSEKNVHVLDDKEKKNYLEEIQRLKEHLLQLDEEIVQEARNNEEKVRQLEEEIATRDTRIERLEDRIEADIEDIIFNLSEENEHLKEMIKSARDERTTLQAERDNLQTALDLFQASNSIVPYRLINLIDFQEELSLQMTSSNRRIAELEESLERAQVQLEKQKVNICGDFSTFLGI